MRLTVHPNLMFPPASLFSVHKMESSLKRDTQSTPPSNVPCEASTQSTSKSNNCPRSVTTQKVHQNKIRRQITTRIGFVLLMKTGFQSAETRMFCTVTLKEGICCTISLNTWLHTWTPVKVTKGKTEEKSLPAPKHDSV